MAHCVLASFYAKQGRPDEAIVQLREALAANEIDLQLIATAHLYLADLLTAQGRIDEALTHCDQAVRAFPTSTVFRARSAVAFARAGRHDRAIAEWRETLRLSPASLEARLGLANALLAGGDAGEAVALCREIVGQEPGATEAIATLGAALAAEGQVDEALPYLNQALELDPRSATAHFHLGLALSGRGRTRSAMAHLNAAIQLQPDNVPMLWQTAWILATSSDPSIRDGVAGGRAGHPSDPAFQGAGAAGLRCAGCRAGRKREVLRGRRDSRASVDNGPGPRRCRVGRCHRAAGAPLSPGITVSSGGIAAAGWARAARSGGVNAFARHAHFSDISFAGTSRRLVVDSLACSRIK